ncbi:DEAD/DEAH box helicase [Actinomadura sp. GC306]|uniref:SNF2-related protein n=1 Tax=Actinomadura sp. GC306 TaxID=2530367 RepID=UPI0010516CC3|nr:DEAD/DEAH box helicase [Actinomadura sp. GC306]TDC70044.1 DEAD/DEAH box helicase [Actinomadura sp. GC306]
MRKRVRRVLRDGEALRRAASLLVSEYSAARGAVEKAAEPLRRTAARRRLENVPVTRLKELGDGPVRFAAVRGAELVSVADVLDSTSEGLRLLRGVGRLTAERLYMAAWRLRSAAERAPDLRIEIGARDEAATPLVRALYRLVNASPDLPRARVVAERVDGEAGPLLAGARAVTWPRRMFRPEFARAAGWEAVARLAELLDDPDTALLWSPDLLGPYVRADEAWRDHERRAGDYRAVLAESSGREELPAEGFLPARLAGRVRAQPLDETFLRVPLRDYQSFGARFALLQRRVILGDEPGLGKAVQAIAAIAHRRAEGATHFLVACPGGLVPGWVRDINACSSITAHPEPGRQGVREWFRLGGIAVTRLDSLPELRMPPGGLGMLVVDEAHRTANRGTRRATSVTRLCHETEDVMLLTGVPLHDRIGDFRRLVAHFPPEAAEPIDWDMTPLGARAFRAAAATVHLRRDHRDVLAELPDVVHVDELVPASHAGRAAYRRAEGDVPAMRRAGYAVPAASAKLRRLRDLVGEAAANGVKVVVLSCFADVLATVHDALGADAFGPVTGRTPVARRADVVARFSAAPGHAVLLAEVEVPLRLGGASVVIFCEPQPDPGVEARAVGRVHGAGGAGPVRVHRLVTPGTVDDWISTGEVAG